MLAQVAKTSDLHSGRCWVRMLAESPTTLKSALVYLSPSTHVPVRCLRSGHGHFLPHPFPFIT